MFLFLFFWPCVPSTYNLISIKKNSIICTLVFPYPSISFMWCAISLWNSSQVLMKCPYSSHWLHGLIHLHHFHSKSSFVFYDYILTCYWLNERPLFFIITNVFFFCKFLQLGNPKKRMENPTKEFLKLNFFLPYLDAKNLEVAKFFKCVIVGRHN